MFQGTATRRRVLVAACVAAALGCAAHASAGISEVFSPSDMKHCVRIRTPSLMYNERTGVAHVVARCCGPNMCSAKSDVTEAETPTRGRRLDNNKDASVVMKTSYDNGKTWKNFQTLSPDRQTGYANGAGIYNSQNGQLVVQFQFFPSGSTAPAVNTHYFQIISDDDGVRWSAPTEITSQLGGCNSNPNDMMCQSAGSKTQTPSGRLLWPAHNHGGKVCVWYSDDGGKTYNTSNTVPGNEVSVAVGDGWGPGRVGQMLMNGRPEHTGDFRSRYTSIDNGATWSRATASPLKNDDGSGCERAFRNVNGTLYSLEPQAPKRTEMVLTCSRDFGRTWKSTRSLNGNHRGGYSDIVGLRDGSLLVVWENGNHPSEAMEHTDDQVFAGNMYSKEVPTTWCT